MNNSQSALNSSMGDLEVLIDILPPHIKEPLRQREDMGNLLEVVLDLGRPAEARFPDTDTILNSREVTEDDLQYVVARLGDFGGDNRAGIERTLHRISAIRNRHGKVIGITCRVGRYVFGTTRVIEDMVNSGQNILLLGRPGVGKTTMLREVARVLADDARKRVVIVDTSNEIAGDGDIPHPAIGRARRMQVPRPELQHAVMIEAVENHMPEVIIIDEIGTELEAAAARTIAERGVQLVATAHGNILENLVMNPTLSDLVGGVQSVILSDEEARRRRTQKAILERKAPPTFDIVVEIRSWERVAVHAQVARVVDKMLRGVPISPEVRWIDENGEVGKERQERETNGDTAFEQVVEASYPALDTAPLPEAVRLFPFGVNRGKVEQAVRNARMPIKVVRDLQAADVFLTTKSHYKRHPQALVEAETSGRQVHVIRKNSLPQIEQFLRDLTRSRGDRPPGVSPDTAIEEAEDAVERVLAGKGAVELSPQSSYVRRLQHLLAEEYNLRSTSNGSAQNRRVTIYRSSGEG
ncbi:MAG: AAA family ATPase [Chloroflexi bacterium]|nr:AAA family ATPase [Chloroflexota bacterium]